MGVFFYITLILAVAIGGVMYSCHRDGELPQLPENEYWGSKANQDKKVDTSLRPFKINIGEDILKDLNARITMEMSSGRYTPPLEDVGFEYGFNTKFLSEVMQYWKSKYNWKQRETMMNKYPHFKTNIGGIDIHYQHGKSLNKKYKKTYPILVVHGWPGSFLEYGKLIPILSEPEGDDVNFEMILVSLPGFGFSEASHRKLMGMTEMAQIFIKLMERIGYDEYFLMGSDFGTGIINDMARIKPARILGLYSLSCASTHPRTNLKLFLTSFYPSYFVENEKLLENMYPLTKLFTFLLKEMGYMHLHATKPDTVGVALSQSPSGLAAYILEKFSTWTDRNHEKKMDGGLKTFAYSMDDLLDNVMIYWTTNSITTSMRLYSEAFSSNRRFNTDSVPIHTVPVGCLAMPEDLVNMPPFLLSDTYRNLTRYTVAEKGGHFGAYEVPQIVGKEAKEFFRSIVL